jgi:hypothetical protein
VLLLVLVNYPYITCPYRITQIVTGWQRDLLQECVESNPRPSWEDVKPLLLKKLGAPGEQTNQNPPSFIPAHPLLPAGFSANSAGKLMF